MASHNILIWDGAAGIIPKSLTAHRVIKEVLQDEGSCKGFVDATELTSVLDLKEIKVQEGEGEGEDIILHMQDIDSQEREYILELMKEFKKGTNLDSKVREPELPGNVTVAVGLWGLDPVAGIIPENLVGAVWLNKVLRENHITQGLVSRQALQSIINKLPKKKLANITFSEEEDVVRIQDVPGPIAQEILDLLPKKVQEKLNLVPDGTYETFVNHAKKPTRFANYKGTRNWFVRSLTPDHIIIHRYKPTAIKEKYLETLRFPRYMVRIVESEPDLWELIPDDELEMEPEHLAQEYDLVQDLQLKLEELKKALAAEKVA